MSYDLSSRKKCPVCANHSTKQPFMGPGREIWLLIMYSRNQLSCFAGTARNAGKALAAGQSLWCLCGSGGHAPFGCLPLLLCLSGPFRSYAPGVLQAGPLSNPRSPTRGMAENRCRMQQTMLEWSNKGVRPIVIIDEAHELGRPCWLSWRFALNFQADSYSPMTILLLGQPRLKEQLQLQILECISQRVNVCYGLPPLSEDEVSCTTCSRPGWKSRCLPMRLLSWWPALPRAFPG